MLVLTETGFLKSFLQFPLQHRLLVIFAIHSNYFNENCTRCADLEFYDWWELIVWDVRCNFLHESFWRNLFSLIIQRFCYCRCKSFSLSCNCMTTVPPSATFTKFYYNRQVSSSYKDKREWRILQWPPH